MQKKSRVFHFIFSLFAGGFTAAPVFAAAQFDNPTKGGFLIDWGGNNTFAGLLTNLINLGLSIAGLVAVLFIIYGGFIYMTSAGNEERTETGKKTLINAIIGLVVIILSYIIVSVINNALA